MLTFIMSLILFTPFLGGRIITLLIWVIILIGLFLIWRSLVNGNGTFRLLEMDIPLIVLGFIGILSAFVNYTHAQGSNFLVHQTLSLIAFLIVIKLASTYDLRESSMWPMYWLVILGGLLSLQALFNYVLGGAAGETREYSERGFFIRLAGIMDPNNLAGLLDMVIPLAFIWALKVTISPKKILLIFLTLLMLSTVLFTFSRTSWIAQAIVLGFIVLVQRKLRMKGLFILSFIVIPLSVSFGAFVFRFRSIASPLDAASLARAVLWKAAFATFLGNPILGVGFGNFAVAKMKYGWIRTLDPYGYLSAHNIYFETLADLGLPGFLALLWLIMLALLGLIRFIKNEEQSNLRIFGAGILGGLVAYLLHGLFDCFLGMPLTLIILGILLGFSFRLSHISQQKHELNMGSAL